MFQYTVCKVQLADNRMAPIVIAASNFFGAGKRVRAKMF